MSEPGLSDVYDIFYPSPPALKKLASIEVALDLWRREIVKCRTNNTLRDLFQNESDLPVSTLLSNTPSVVATVEEFVEKVMHGIRSWLTRHIEKKFLPFDILNNFENFVCDFHGKIHSRRTAKQIVLCDGIDDVLKFEIACLNCLEEEITKLWPSVSSLMDLNKIDIEKNPQKYYWVCRMKNQLYKVPCSPDFSGSVDEILAEKVCWYWPSLEYFLNRLNSDIRSKKIVELIEDLEKYRLSTNTVCRYLLTMLNEAELRALMAQETVYEALILSKIREFDLEEKFLPSWWFIKNILPDNVFITMIQKILYRQIYNVPVLYRDVSSWCEIWTTAPDHLKQAFISSVLSDGLPHPDFFDSMGLYFDFSQVSFLLAILSDMSIDDRKSFWNQNWRALVFDKELEDLRRLVDLCFIDQAEFEQFKAAELSQYENIRAYCVKLFETARFQHLNEYLQFLFNDEQSVMDMKRRILPENGLFLSSLFEEAVSLNRFIDEAYGSDVDLAIAFKRQLFSHPDLDNLLTNRVLNYEFRHILRFANTFSKSVGQQIVDEFKKNKIEPLMKKYFSGFIGSACCNYICDDLSTFMNWLFSNGDELAQFKETISPDDVVQGRIQQGAQMYYDESGWRDPLLDGDDPVQWSVYDKLLINFLRWYFESDEAVEEFKAKYADDDIFVQLITE